MFYFSFVLVEPKLTDEMERISIFGIRPGTENFNLYDAFKILLMSLDLRIREDYFISDVFIIDFKNLTASLIKNFTLPAVKKFADCGLVSKKQIHVGWVDHGRPCSFEVQL